MTLPQIKALPVGDHAADGSHLYLWTTDAFYEAALDVARAWGFEKSATLVWCKKPMGKGLGGTYPSNVEFVLFCQRVDNRGWKEFGAWLRERRLEVGLTTGRVCEAIGAHGKVNHGGMQSNWENGLGVPRMDQWEKIKPLLGVNGKSDEWLKSLQTTRGSRGVSRWHEWKRGKHSQKPEQFQDMVEQVSHGPYLELFARRKRLGWSAWGNEIDSDISLQNA